MKAMVATHPTGRWEVVLPAGRSNELMILGENIDNTTEISFTPRELEAGASCNDVKRLKSFSPRQVLEGKGAKYAVRLDPLDKGEHYYFLCAKTRVGAWIYQSSDLWMRILALRVEPKPEGIVPKWVYYIFLVCLLCLSGLFSGLTLGLMSLDKTELKIIEKCGAPNEKAYAKIIAPLREKGNYLLCTLLFGNVLVNNTIAVLTSGMLVGPVAIFLATLAIVLFGEIFPQAICSRHGLAVGAQTHLLTKLFMVLTFPLSYPMGRILDKLLGDEIGQVYNKEKLQELIRMTADFKVLQNEEANIITGALQLSTKRVEDIMTRMEDVYMLDINTVLDFETLSEILRYGYTRVPVYDGDRTNIVQLLNTKDLALIDPDDNTELKTVCRFYDHQPLFVFNDTKLDAMLQAFLQGNSHMAVVQHAESGSNHDQEEEQHEQVTRNLGIVTLEDVIEEILQNEIIDETDILTDNRGKKPRVREKKLDYNIFEKKQQRGQKIPQQLAFAAFQYLSTAVEPFKEPYISRSVLKQLLRQNIVISLTPNDCSRERNYIYRKGRECDFFTLILEGHVEVEIGKESMVFETGPFTCFGTECLACMKEMRMEAVRDVRDSRLLVPYIPDFSVRVITQVQFLKIRRVHYLAARRITYMQTLETTGASDDQETFHAEWKRCLSRDVLSRQSSVPGNLDLTTNERKSIMDRLRRASVLSRDAKDQAKDQEAKDGRESAVDQKGRQLPRLP